MTLILPFQNQVRDIMKKGKVIKENRYTQQIPKSNFQWRYKWGWQESVSLSANENNFPINKQSRKCRTIQNFKSNQRLLSIKHSDLDPKIISLLTKIKKWKFVKWKRKDFNP